MMSDQITSLSIDQWNLKLRIPSEVDNAPVVVMLHGWTGDENSMWIFANKLNPEALIIAPRGLFLSDHPELAGFSWIKDTSIKFANRSDFKHSVDRLHALLNHLLGRFPANFSELNLVGFSQGAAMAGEYLLTHPESVSRLAMLSGFLAEGSSHTDADLIGKEVFIGHGTKDEAVPLEKAQYAELLFASAGAQVTSCLTDVGHRLGADCFRGFNHFFENL
jgi:phospholipase/carboxylesterase